MIDVPAKNIIDDINIMLKGESHARHLYASLLRILISPSIYQIGVNEINSIITAIRKAEENPAYLEVLKTLDRIAPIENH